MGFRAFNDSDAGIVLATVLHTAGAIALLGGLVAYLVWARHLRKGRNEPATLLAAAAITVAASVANLVGGFLRTYESDHPGLSQFETSAWVRVLAVKHVFIFAGIAAALALVFPIADRLRAAARYGKPLEPKGPEKAAVAIAFLGIAVASVLGAIGSITPLPMATDLDGMGPDPRPGSPVMPASTRYHNATGVLPILPGQPAPTASFDVPPAASLLEATLSWTPDVHCLQLTLLSPSGNATATAAGQPPCEGEAALEVPLPEAGSWTYQVSSAQPAPGVMWTLTVRIPTVGAANETVVADTVTIRPGGGFHEVNTVMPANGTLRWDWSSDDIVHFNIHSHFDDEVQDYLDEDTDASAGSFTVEREGGYSYLWVNEGPVPVTLTYRVWGPFTVDSIVDV